jgi:hypothetical protein
VQLYQKRKKLATMWPTARRVRLPGRKLAAGRYQLVIWSGVGLKRRARYAKTPWVAERLRVVN